MFESLKNAPRLLLEQELRPVQGDRFQPTGFADLGAADYRLHDGRRMLLVESAQSVANRLEQTCLNGSGPDIAPELAGLPYVKAKLQGVSDAETSSLIEAHRINSPFIISDSEFQTQFLALSGYEKGKQVDWRKAAAALFHFDPNALLHGVFMANLLDGRMRFPRTVTGFVEASDVMEAVSGGVKNNPLDPTGKIRAENYDKDVYSNVPYPRVEYTAASIKAYFNLDLALIASYGLPEAACDLLIALALWKIQRFLSGGLRLRTACDLTPSRPMAVTAPAGFEVPAEPALLAKVQDDIRACTDAGLFAVPPVTVIDCPVVMSAEGDKKDKSTAK
jgi:CRISPR-associated protein Csb1